MRGTSLTTRAGIEKGLTRTVGLVIPLVSILPDPHVFSPCPPQMYIDVGATVAAFQTQASRPTPKTCHSATLSLPFAHAAADAQPPLAESLQVYMLTGVIPSRQSIAGFPSLDGGALAPDADIRKLGLHKGCLLTLTQLKPGQEVQPAHALTSHAVDIVAAKASIMSEVRKCTGNLLGIHLPHLASLISQTPANVCPAYLQAILHTATFRRPPSGHCCNDTRRRARATSDALAVAHKMRTRLSQDPVMQCSSSMLSKLWHSSSTTTEKIRRWSV
jgi:hypothetical protein